MQTQAPLPMDAEFTDEDGAAEFLGVSKPALRNGRSTGRGITPPYVKLGHVVRYHVPTLREWALSQIRRPDHSDSG